MTVARLFADENFPLPVAEELRRLGHDVVTIQESGRAGVGTSDEDVLNIATAAQRAVLTYNRKHFVKLHQNAPAHAGIVVCTVDVDFVGQADRIHSEIQSFADLKGRLVRVNRQP